MCEKIKESHTLIKWLAQLHVRTGCFWPSLHIPSPSTSAFFVPFKNGFHAFLWCRLHTVTLIIVWPEGLDLHRFCLDIRVFPKWNRNSMNSVNSGHLIIHWSMNWSQFKHPVSHMWLDGRFEPFYCSDKYCCPWIQRIQWKHLGKIQLLWSM